MTSSGLEWDSLDCPLVGLPSGCRFPFPTDTENSAIWHSPNHSLWSMSPATGCSPSPTTGGSGKGRLRQEEEEGRRQWRRAEKEPGESGRVKEVSHISSYWASRNCLFILSSLKIHSSPTNAASPRLPPLLTSPSSSSSSSCGNHPLHSPLNVLHVQRFHLWLCINVNWTFLLGFSVHCFYMFVLSCVHLLFMCTSFQHHPPHRRSCWRGGRGGWAVNGLHAASQWRLYSL